MLAGWLEQRARNMELSEKVSQIAIIIMSRLVFEMHLLVLMLHLNLLCWPLKLRFINVCCFSHYLFDVA